jgi:hypothetical protein
VFIISEAVQIGGVANYEFARLLFVIVALIMLWEIAPRVRHLPRWKYMCALVAIVLTLIVATGAAWRYLAPLPTPVIVRSHIHIDGFEIATSNDTVFVNVHFVNDGHTEAVSQGYYYLVVEKFPGDEAEPAMEGRLFAKFLNTIHPNTTGVQHIPVGARRYVTDPIKPKKEKFAELQAVTGTYALYFMGRFIYTDESGEHHSDYCAFSKGFGNAAIFMCQKHNEEP